MSLSAYECPNCGAALKVNAAIGKGICEYCGTVVTFEKENETEAEVIPLKMFDQKFNFGAFPNIKFKQSSSFSTVHKTTIEIKNTFGSTPDINLGEEINFGAFPNVSFGEINDLGAINNEIERLNNISNNILHGNINRQVNITDNENLEKANMMGGVILVIAVAAIFIIFVVTGILSM